MTNSGNTIKVDFWFDAVCPWTWLTSRWILEVRESRPIEINWRVMSLAVLNESRMDELPDRIRDLMGRSWAPMRTLMAAQEQFGPAVLEPLYNALGSRYHPLGEPVARETIDAALKEAGLPLDLAEAGETDAYDTALRESHRAGTTLVGGEVGSPIIAVPSADTPSGKITFFGPVVTPTPKGKHAVNLWDGVLAVAGTPGFYEIKRTRTAGPDYS